MAKVERTIIYSLNNILWQILQPRKQINIF